VLPFLGALVLFVVLGLLLLAERSVERARRRPRLPGGRRGRLPPGG